MNWKFLTTGLMLGLIASTMLLAPAGGRELKPRRVEKAYAGFSGLAQNFNGETVVTPSPSTSLTFRARGDESLVHLRVVDSIGERVRTLVTYHTDNDGRPDGVADLCGFTNKPLAIAKGSRVTVDLYAGTCADGEPSVVSRGTVTAAFSR